MLWQCWEEDKREEWKATSSQERSQSNTRRIKRKFKSKKEQWFIAHWKHLNHQPKLRPDPTQKLFNVSKLTQWSFWKSRPKSRGVQARLKCRRFPVLNWGKKLLTPSTQTIWLRMPNRFIVSQRKSRFRRILTTQTKFAGDQRRQPRNPQQFRPFLARQ